MDIRIIDRWRGVTVVPTKQVTGKSDPFEVMDGLIEQMPEASVQHHQVLIEADHQFADLITKAKRPADADFTPAAVAGEPRWDTYKGVPLQITEPT